MVQSAFYKDMLVRVSTKEQELSLGGPDSIGQSYVMATFLREALQELKEYIFRKGFEDPLQEIEFFRKVKPQVLGRLIFYNEVYRIEISCPFRLGKMYHKFFAGQLQRLKSEFKEHLADSEFYRYYRSGRTDLDAVYFRLGNLEQSVGLNSFLFETDSRFSTYYDYKAARIIAADLLYGYLLARASPEQALETQPLATEDICWTGTKNALIELIYALHTSGAISDGKVGLRRVSMVLQSVFRIPLGDIHHAFHRMKDRAGKRTLFIDQLKSSLEEYMDREL